MKDLEVIRHSLSHIMAYAVKELFPTTKFAIGPSIENGFYYDFDPEQHFTADDLKQIQKKMEKLISGNLEFKREEISKDEAKEIFKDQPYKLELIEDVEGDIVSIYTVGSFVDLCKGPHVDSTKELVNIGFKLHKTCGAYWRGNEKNKMLSRIYAYAFTTKEELNAYIKQQEEAQKRDHNKLGRELEIFSTVDYIGQGLPILLPRGTKLFKILNRWVEDEEEARGYIQTRTPLMAKSDLYKISEHWYHYRENMFILGNPDSDKEVLALRPMTCPFQFQAYLNKTRSYRDLPMRINETSTLFRNEDSGEMHGMIRVRQFTISEGHLAVLPEQLEEEFKGCLDLAVYMLKSVGLDKDVSYRFSKWDPNNKDKYMGSQEEWERVQDKMRDILNDLEL
ncbi:MAG: threonine--tRNA ligase, partial [Clostridia bacterium]|nr:threonine--tRNA ligase [Clostridia bacterium]